MTIALVPVTAASAASPASGSKAASPAKRPELPKLGSFDIRTATTTAQRAVEQQRVAKTVARPDVQSLRDSLGVQGVVDVDGFTGTPRQIAKVDGFLTGTSHAAARDVALGYVRSHQSVFGLSSSDLAGLRLDRDYVDIAGTHHLSFSQTVGGVALFGNGLRANVAKDGRLINVQGSPVAGLSAPGAVAKPQIGSASAAIAAARKDLGEHSLKAAKGDVASSVLFQTSAGTRRAWRVVTMGASSPSLHVFDAETGRVLYRESLSDDANDPAAAAQTSSDKAKVYDNYPGAPKGGNPHVVDFAAKHWLPAGAPALYGNNAHTYTDINDDNAASSTEEVGSQGANGFIFPLVRTTVADEPPCDVTYVCTWNPDTPGSWAANRERTATNNFYLVNMMHDHLQAAPIGFTEAAGNFQQVNSSGQGQGGDPVVDEPLDGANTAGGLPDGSHIDNANMATPPDGQSPRMQMYLFHAPGEAYPTGDPFLAVTGSDEADVVYHEYTHGLSNRLVTYPDGSSGLGVEQAGAMGEAWSDWYAMDFLNNEGFEVDTKAPGEVRVGDYVGAGQDLIRSQPLDCPVGSTSPKCHGTTGAGPGGYTYGDLGKISSRGPEVHADGEIWGETLWDLRTKLGSKLSESLVTRAMELSPVQPSMLDMRNSILQADQVVYGGKHRTAIWRTFATRGMGYFAAVLDGSDTHPVEDFSMPPTGRASGRLTGTVTESQSGTPVAGAVVAFGGHDSGFAGDLVATSDAQGHYVIRHIYPGRYADVRASGPGYLPSDVRTLSIHQGANQADWTVTRDWAASSGGARIAETNDDTSAPYGCGAAALIDLQQGNGWSAYLPAAGSDVHAVVALPNAVDISKVMIDPTGTCGDDISASTGDYRVETSVDGTTWTTAATGHFTPAQDGTYVTVPLAAGSTAGVKYVRYVMLGTQTADFGVDCTTRVTSGCVFVDSRELVVEGSAS